jgi:hypothetical protein
VNIIEAMEDDAVFGQHFVDEESWAQWRIFLKALFGLEMSDEEHAVYRECTGRDDHPDKLSTSATLIVGRRGGKSRILALVAVFLAAFKDWRPYLAAGERGHIMIVAGDREQAQAIMNFVKGFLYATPMLKQLIESDREEKVQLSNGIDIAVFTCSFRRVRGRTVVAALLDEVAIWRTDEASASPDREVIVAIKPSMLTVPGSIMLIASSPYARKGVLWQNYQDHWGKVGEPLCWLAPTLKMFPKMPPEGLAEMEAHLRRDKAEFEAEYLCKWRTDVEQFISFEIVQACTDAGIYERPCERGIPYRAFVDVAGGSGGDSFALAIAHRAGDTAVLDCLRVYDPPFSPDHVIDDVAKVMQRYKLVRCFGDDYGSDITKTLFRQAGLTYRSTDWRKSEIYLNTLPLLNSGRVRLLDHQKMLNQLLSLERRPQSGGHDSVDHPKKQHDDACNAACGALLHAFARKGDPTYAFVDTDRPSHQFKTYEQLVRKPERLIERGWKIGPGESRGKIEMVALKDNPNVIYSSDEEYWKRKKR